MVEQGSRDGLVRESLCAYAFRGQLSRLIRYRIGRPSFPWETPQTASDPTVPFAQTQASCLRHSCHESPLQPTVLHSVPCVFACILEWHLIPPCKYVTTWPCSHLAERIVLVLDACLPVLTLIPPRADLSFSFWSLIHILQEMHVSLPCPALPCPFLSRPALP